MNTTTKVLFQIICKLKTVSLIKSFKLNKLVRRPILRKDKHSSALRQNRYHNDYATLTYQATYLPFLQSNEPHMAIEKGKYIFKRLLLQAFLDFGGYDFRDF